MADKSKQITICYFGIYDPNLSRNKVYISALKKGGVKVIECNDCSSGFRKYINLFIKHQKIRNQYDIMVVGYGGWLVVPLARILSRKPIIFDALCSLYDADVISRGFSKFSIKYLITIILDFMAFQFADIILFESYKQIDFIARRYRVNPRKCFRLFTGVDEESFFFDPKISKRDEFTVLFRGRFLPEAGVQYIIKAANLLQDYGVNFLIIGFGFEEKKIENLIRDYAPRNIQWIKTYLPTNELRNLMLSCHISLGQFEKNERLERTIPHKAFESLAMKLPYVTGRADGIRELLEDKKTCLLVNLADPSDLADKILQLKNNEEFRNYLAENGYELFKKKFSSDVLGGEFLQIIKDNIILAKNG